MQTCTCVGNYMSEISIRHENIIGIILSYDFGSIFINCINELNDQASKWSMESQDEY